MQPQNLDREMLDNLNRLVLAMHVRSAIDRVFGMKELDWWHTRTDVGTVVSFKLCEEKR